jgi:hypothetical protein
MSNTWVDKVGIRVRLRVKLRLRLRLKVEICLKKLPL